MEIKHRSKGDMNIIDLSGSLDIYTSTDFKLFLEEILSEQNNKVIVNMEKVTYIDSSGIGMLIKQMNILKEMKGQFFLACMKPNIEKVFKIAGLIAYFKFIPESDFKANYL